VLAAKLKASDGASGLGPSREDSGYLVLTTLILGGRTVHVDIDDFSHPSEHLALHVGLSSAAHQLGDHGGPTPGAYSQELGGGQLPSAKKVARDEIVLDLSSVVPPKGLIDSTQPASMSLLNGTLDVGRPVWPIPHCRTRMESGPLAHDVRVGVFHPGT
jgi:hypothetical protein